MRSLEFDNYMFDLYGTLIDIRTDEHDIKNWIKWCDWLDKKGLKHEDPETMHEVFFERDLANRRAAKAEWGFDCPEIDVTPIYREMFIEYGNPAELFTQEFLDEIGYAFRSATRDYMRLFPGVEDFLKDIRNQGKHAYILSNAQKSYTWPEICHFSLQDMVDDIMMSSDFRVMKPDRVFFNIMLDKHAMDRTKTVMIGDSRENDYQGALDAGINAIWLGPDTPAKTFYLE